MSSLPPAKALLADRGYDADWLRDALADQKIEACIPSKSNRKTQIPHDKLLYKKRHKIENMFGKMKDRRHTLQTTIRAELRAAKFQPHTRVEIYSICPVKARTLWVIHESRPKSPSTL